MRVERQISINAPAEKVFGYVSDFLRHPEWAAHRLEIQPMSEGAVAVGSTFSSVGHEMGTHKAQVKVTELAPGSRLAFEAEDDTGHFRHWFQLEQAQGGTRLAKGVESLRLSLIMRLMTPLFPLMVPRGLDGDLKRIKAKVEGGAS